MDAEQKTSLKGLPMGLLSWFVAGIGLTAGYKFTVWLLGILHLG